MNPSQFATPAEEVRNLPLRRLTDVHAWTDAAAALQSAAARAREDDGVLADALTAAGAFLDGETSALDRLRDAVTSAAFLPLLRGWIRELRQVASVLPESGACTVGTALELWSWTMRHLSSTSSPQVVDELVEALCPLLAARCLAVSVAGAADASDAALRCDLSHAYAARVSASAGATCAELVFGYRNHLTWDAAGCATCFDADSLEGMEAWMPGIASGARANIDVIEADGSHPVKAGPCAGFEGLDHFMRLRKRLDGCLTGARIAKDRAAATLARSITSGGRA